MSGTRRLRIAAAALALGAGACGRTQLDADLAPGGQPGTAGSSSGAGGAGASGGSTGLGGAAGIGGATGQGGTPGAGGARGIVQVVAGDNHTCALLADGSVRCWGKNDVGQLGHGDRITIGDDELPSSAPPVSVSAAPGVTVKQLAAGVDITCALLSDGAVKCWGRNDNGQLGYGNRNIVGDDEPPSSAGTVSVSATPGLRVAAIATGGNHTCVVLSDGAVKCWGSSSNGQLGYGNRNTIGDDELPSSVGAVEISKVPGVTATRLAAGRFATCAVLSDKTLRCWGFNAFGQLGYGHTIPIGDDELPSISAPVSVSNTPGVVATDVVAGDFHTCALLSDGTVRCWGSSIDGEVGAANKSRIGDNEPPSSIPPVSISPNPGVTVAALAAGFDHTCAVLSDRSLRCWGANVFAELGLGNLANVGDDELPSTSPPVSVTTAAGVSVVQVAGGYGHTCVLLSDATIKCWGDNRYGQLGYGHTRTIGDDELPSSVGPVSVY